MNLAGTVEKFFTLIPRSASGSHSIRPKKQFPGLESFTTVEMHFNSSRLLRGVFLSALS